MVAAAIITGIVLVAAGASPAEAPIEREPATTTTVAPTTTTTVAPTTTTVPPTTTTTRPVPTTTRPSIAQPAPTPRATQCPPEIVALIHKHWDRFGPEVVEWAIGIAWRESNCRGDVVSSTFCYSVFQMALGLHAGFYAAAGYPDWYAVRFDAEASIAAAALLYASAGPGPWRL